MPVWVISGNIKVYSYCCHSETEDVSDVRGGRQRPLLQHSQGTTKGGIRIDGMLQRKLSQVQDFSNSSESLTAFLSVRFSSHLKVTFKGRHYVKGGRCLRHFLNMTLKAISDLPVHWSVRAAHGVCPKGLQINLSKATYTYAWGAKWYLFSFVAEAIFV